MAKRADGDEKRGGIEMKQTSEERAHERDREEKKKGKGATGWQAHAAAA